jgi:hypothetical protein
MHPTIINLVYNVLGGPMCRWKDTTETGCGDRKWVKLAKDRIKAKASVRVMVKLCI